MKNGDLFFHNIILIDLEEIKVESLKRRGAITLVAKMRGDSIKIN